MIDVNVDSSVLTDSTFFAPTRLCYFGTVNRKSCFSCRVLMIRRASLYIYIIPHVTIMSKLAKLQAEGGNYSFPIFFGSPPLNKKKKKSKWVASKIVQEPGFSVYLALISAEMPTPSEFGSVGPFRARWQVAHRMG